MSKTLIALALIMAITSPSFAEKKDTPLQFTMKDIDGKDVDLSKYLGKVVLIVNVASRCGNTPQYEQLQAIYTRYTDKGLVVLGFPANEFRGQEPGTNEEIKQFCTTKYAVTFPMFSKVVVKGDDTCDLYKFLTSKETNPATPGAVTWNFEKFLIGKDGKIAARFTPKTKPDAPEVVKVIEEQLAK